MNEMEEYRIDIKVRNNLIVKRIEKAGYKTVGEFCRLNNIMNQVSHLGDIINMKCSPLRSDGKWQNIIIKCSELLLCSPEDFFTQTQINTILKTNRKHIEVQEAEMRFMLENNNEQKLLEDIVYQDQKKIAVDKILETLTPREKKILEMRNGLGEFDHFYTLYEIAEILGISAPRIRQIEMKAMRKLRHPSRSDALKEFLKK